MSGKPPTPSSNDPDIAAAAGLFRSLDRELWVLTAATDGLLGGLITTTVAQASIVESRPRVTVGLARQHHTPGLVAQSSAFALHLIAPEQSDWVWHFGTQSGRDVDKFAGIAHRPGVTGAPLLEGARGWLECRVENSMETGDRDWYLAEVVSAGWTPGFQPLTFHELLQGATEERRDLLKRQLAADSLTDAAAIDLWRGGRSN